MTIKFMKFYLKNDLKKERARLKKLEKELRRKEKALAETAALLVLRKKGINNVSCIHPHEFIYMYRHL